LANRWPGGAAREERDGLIIERCWERDRLSVLPNLITGLRRSQPDVVWFNLGLSIYGKSPVVNFSGHVAPLLSRLADRPTVVTLHELFEMADLAAIGATNNWLMQLGGALATRLILSAHLVCLTLKPYADLVQQKYNVRNVRHVPHGAFDPPRFIPLPAEKRLLYFGLHAPYKGLKEFLELYAELRADDPAVTLSVAGSDHPRFPGYFAAMRAAHAHLPGITWLPNIPEARLPSIFESARVVALPYVATTGASSVSHRAASHGRPVVAYALRDLQTVATEENLQIEFVPNGDRAEFKNRLKLLLDNPAECERIGQANVTAMRAYTLETTCWRYVTLFESVAKLRAIARPVPEIEQPNFE
jgi:glycosyltransferase involved in cell wall biosynthesis